MFIATTDGNSTTMLRMEYNAARRRNNSFAMAQLTTEQRVFIVEKFNETGSVNEVRRQFPLAFPDRNTPSASSIWRNVTKYNAHGSSLK